MTLSNWPERRRLASQAVHRFLRWWLAELSALLPGSLLHRVTIRKPAGAVLHYRQDSLQLIVPNHDGPASILTLPHNPDPSSQRRVQETLTLHRRSVGITVRLDPALIFETVVDIPSAGEPSRRSILQHQLQRIIPIPIDEVRFDYVVIRQARRDALLRVHVAVAKRAVLDHAVEQAQAAGLVPSTVVAAPTTLPIGGDPAPLTLWRATERRTPLARGRKRLLQLLEAAIVLTAAGCYGVYVYELRLRSERFGVEVAAARAEAASVQELSRRVDLQNKAADFFRAHQSDRTPLQVLDTLTALLPGDTWITHFTQRGRAAQIMGISPHALDLIAKIEASPVLEHPHFQSSVTLSPDGRSDRFNLAFDIRASGTR